MPQVPTGPLYRGTRPGIVWGRVLSADSTVASCCRPCISIIFGEATLFSIILISVPSATLLSCLCLGGQSIKFSSHKHQTKVLEIPCVGTRTLTQTIHVLQGLGQLRHGERTLPQSIQSKKTVVREPFSLQGLTFQ